MTIFGGLHEAEERLWPGMADRSRRSERVGALMVFSQQHMLAQAVTQKTPHPKNTRRRGYSTGRRRGVYICSQQVGRIYEATGGRRGENSSSGGRRGDHTAGVCTCRRKQAHTHVDRLSASCIYVSRHVSKITETSTTVCQEACQATNWHGCRDEWSTLKPSTTQVKRSQILCEIRDSQTMT